VSSQLYVKPLEPFKHKSYRDPVHGNIQLHPAIHSLMDTPEFQRLDKLRQLGPASWVYRGAQHTRFTHSVGVSHLAGRFLRNLRAHQPELNISEVDILCVEIAGLCHDLGHGNATD
jgi:HD superfamily phosphohydrolase